jgi:hypothetical protein
MSFLVWFFAALLLLGTQAGDCFEQCVSQIQRRVACLPAVSAGPALACSVALKNPRYTGVENSQVLKLFDAWFDRDVTKFRSAED